VQTLTRRGGGDAGAGLGLHFLHMSEGPFSHDAGHIKNLQSFNIPKQIPIFSGLSCNIFHHNIPQEQMLHFPCFQKYQMKIKNALSL